MNILDENIPRNQRDRKQMKQRLCADCQQQTQWQEVSHEFERGGLRVRISGIPAMVCSNCGAVSYPARIPDKLLAAADSLFELMADRHRGALRAEPVPAVAA
jgi:YgiT-type zinc finger domain-containing protein